LRRDAGQKRQPCCERRCRSVGSRGHSFGPIVTSALSRAVEDSVEREALLKEGAEMLARGAVGHNHLWYHRDAIEAFLGARDPKGMMPHVEALEAFMSVSLAG
jgi:hypothetical protein